MLFASPLPPSSLFRWLQPQFPGRQTTNDLTHRQTVKIRKDLEGLAGNVTFAGFHPDRDSFIQPRWPFTAATVQKPGSCFRCLRADPRNESGDDTTSSKVRSHVEPLGLCTEHAPEHVMDQAPLSHTDNLTVPFRHQ